MGYFTCVNCRCSYYDKRFAWEKPADCVPGNPQSADNAWQKPTVLDHARTRCDLVRMTGTAANWTGMAVPAAAHYLSSVSAVGGLVGASCGAAQLHQGLSMPSGVHDPHLMAKGGVTSAVGCTCMMLGAAASAWPSLFYGAAGLGVTGLISAVTIDAHVDGLCLACRGCTEIPTPETPQPRSQCSSHQKGDKVVCRNSKDLALTRETPALSSCWRWVGHLSLRLCQAH